MTPSPVPPAKRTRTSNGNSHTPNTNEASPQDGDTDGPLLPGQLRCEFCHIVGRADTFLPPSRRFCSLTCCKRYSAEKRYYPYGRDEEGIAKSIQEGLLNPKSRCLRPGANKQVGVVNSKCEVLFLNGEGISVTMVGTTMSRFAKWKSFMGQTGTRVCSCLKWWRRRSHVVDVLVSLCSSCYRPRLCATRGGGRWRSMAVKTALLPSL